MSFLPRITPSEIIELTLGLKLSGDCYLEIHAKMFKIIIDFISLHLSNIFNKYVEMSYFPDLFKIERFFFI